MRSRMVQNLGPARALDFGAHPTTRRSRKSVIAFEEVPDIWPHGVRIRDFVVISRSRTRLSRLTQNGSRLGLFLPLRDGWARSGTIQDCDLHELSSLRTPMPGLSA